MKAVILGRGWRDYCYCTVAIIINNNNNYKQCRMWRIAAIHVFLLRSRLGGKKNKNNATLRRDGDANPALGTAGGR